MIMLSEGTFIFNLLIMLDRLFNVLTGGELGTCFSTRAYVNSKSSPNWEYIRKFIDRMFWEDHCKDTLVWELKMKKLWVSKYTKEIE